MPHSGKSEVRNILVREHGFHLLDTKAILQEIAGMVTGLGAWDFISQADKAEMYNGVSRRTIMGEIGNCIEGMFGDSFLLDRALERLDRFNMPDKKVVVDSLRKDQTLNFPGLVYEVISDKSIDTGNDFDLYNKSRTNGIICNMDGLSELSDTVKRVFNL